jgi:hypothetical protein
MEKQSSTHTCQVSYTYTLNGDADLDCESIGWPVRSIYGFCNEPEDEAVVCDRDDI